MSTDAQDLPTSRAEARRLGAPRYRTGRACRHGHHAERLTSNAACTACECLRDEARRGTEARKTYQRERERSPSRTAYRAQREVERRFPDAVPPEYSLDAVASVYAERDRQAELTGEDLYVSHVIALQLGGTHTPDNLAILTRAQRSTKSSLEYRLMRLLTSAPEPLKALQEHRKDLLTDAAELPDAVAAKLLDHATQLAQVL